MTQENRILEYLQAGNTLTPLEALNKFGCFRLSGRIYNLRKKGYDIESTLICGTNHRHFSCYKLKHQEKQYIIEVKELKQI